MRKIIIYLCRLKYPEIAIWDKYSLKELLNILFLQ